MAFDPDKYLAQSSAFDPDAYLGITNKVINTDVPTVVSATPPTPVVEPQRSMMEKMKAIYEVPATIGSSMIAQPVGAGYAVYKALTSPQTGQAASAEGRAAGQQLSQAMTYQPTSPVTGEVLQGIGSALEASKIPPVIPSIGVLPSYARMAQGVPPQVKQAATMPNVLRKAESTMAGVGAAEVPEAIGRTQMAQQLRVPVPLSKGQATRELGQQQFEIETPKNYPELGKPLIEAQAKRNDAILQNFDAFVDATGKEAYGLRATGQIVDKALVESANKAKSKVNEAYTLAREKGETEQPVPYAQLRTFIEEQTPTTRAKIAPILDVVNEQLSKNDVKNTGKISINALEDIYQVINKNFEPNTPSATYGKEMRNIINAITENQGGELYQQARKLRQEYAKQFENIGAIDKLLRTKAGTTDRAVAFEDVFKHSVLDGSLDDVRNLGIALKKGGPKGQQAWRELQGQTIEHLKDIATKSVDIDSFGNPLVSPAKLKSAVRELDQDGKLDYLFGKKGAQEIRDLMETTLLVNAPLKGAANYSNTSSALVQALDRVSKSPIGKTPVIGKIAQYSFEKAQEQALKKKIKESLNYSPENLAKILRKGK